MVNTFSRGQECTTPTVSIHQQFVNILLFLSRFFDPLLPSVHWTFLSSDLQQVIACLLVYGTIRGEFSIDGQRTCRLAAWP